MNAAVQRIQVVLTAAVTWLTFAATVLTIFAEEIATVAPEGAEDLMALIVRLVAWIGTAIAIIRRVSPVLPSERGILPPA